MQTSVDISLLSLKALLVALAVVGCTSSFSQENVPREDDWFASRHGPLVSCHSVQAQADGSYQLDRYLYALPEENLSAETARSYRGLVQQLLVSAGRNPDTLPFHHESYRLNYQMHIVEGDISKGLLPQTLSADQWAPALCDPLHRKVAKILASDLFRHPVVESDTPMEYWRIAVQGEGQKVVAETTLLVNVEEGSTPLMMVARGYPREYKTVFDPLLRQRSMNFDYQSYRPYSHDHIPMWRSITGASSGVALMSAVVASAMNPLFLPGVGVGLGGVLVGLWQMRDIMQTPEYKSEQQQARLIARYKELRQKLVDLRHDGERDRNELANTYGWNHSDHDFQVLVHALRDKKRHHEYELSIEQERLQAMNEQLQSLEEQQDRRDRLDKEFRDVDLQLTQQRNLVVDREKALLKRDKNQTEREALESWDKSMADLKELLTRHSGLQQQRDKQGDQTQLTVMVADMQSRISGQKVVVDEKVFFFEQENSKPLALLESYLHTSHKTGEADEQVQTLKQELDRVKVHVHLMALVTAYQNNQRYHRVQE